MESGDLFNNDTDKSLLTAFAWWEKRRPLYNLFVGATGFIVLFAFMKVPVNWFEIAGIVIYGIIANLFYSTGFFIEVAARYYFKSDVDFTERRKTLYILDIILSVLITIAGSFFYGVSLLLTMK